MNFTQAFNEAMLEFKRPEKAASVRRELNAAVSFYTLDNRFPRDRIEQSIAINAFEHTQSFSLNDLTRFREFEYIKRGGTTAHLSVIDDAAAFKGMLACDKYYIAGSNVNFTMRQTAAALDVSYMTYPPVLSGNQTHWMLDVSPYMIIDRALQMLYRSIGDEKSMQAHAITAREAYLAFRKDQLRSQ